ncbi:hypothetical protein DL770_007400 [Monosporascus sp. CRB-9-2]|nr:hypothetical protein DL770_007400 [Monosporascus sp. CRB-9-2]
MRLERLEQEVRGQSVAQLTGNPSPYTAKLGGGRSEKGDAVHVVPSVEEPQCSPLGAGQAVVDYLLYSPEPESESNNHGNDTDVPLLSPRSWDFDGPSNIGVDIQVHNTFASQYEKEIGGDHSYFSSPTVDLKSPVLETASHIPGTPSSKKRYPYDTKAAESGGRSVLHMAVERKNLSIAWLMIEQGVPVNARDDRGRSALHIAAENGSYPIAELLVRSGADVDQADVSGQTPLHVASRMGTIAVLELLIRETRDVDARDEGKSTALHHAVANDHEEAVRVLVGAGADLGLTK